MQPVHDHDDRPGVLVVEAAVEGVVEPFVCRPALGLRQRLLGFQRVVDDDQVGAAPGQHAADRGGEPAALRRRLELRHRLPGGREPGREHPPVPLADDDAPAIARQFVGELLGVGSAQDLQARLVPETPGRKRDRGQQRLRVPRRQVDDQPADLAAAHRRELRRDELDMPAGRKRGLRIKLGETGLRKACEIDAQQCRDFLGRERRLRSCRPRRRHPSGPADPRIKSGEEGETHSTSAEAVRHLG